MISGNELSGVFVGGSTTAHTVVTGNGIGLNANGNVAVANQNGVEISGASHDNLVSSNSVSGNRNEGVLDRPRRHDRKRRLSNRIGLTPGHRRDPQSAGGGGLRWRPAQHDRRDRHRQDLEHHRRGTRPKGVLLTGSGTNRNLVRGALIGTNAAAPPALPNAPPA